MARSQTRTSTKPATLKPSPVTATRRVGLGVNPAELVVLLDDHFDDSGTRGGSPYRCLYEQMKATYLKAEGENAISISKLLDAMDDMCYVEDAFRRAGFIVGFEVCRQLLLGELDLATLQGGAK